MSTLSNQIVRMAGFSLATVSSFCVAWAQSDEPSNTKPTASQGIAASSCVSPVLPIKRTVKLAKPVAMDWTTLPSTYTHDQDGQRVDQYALAVEPQSTERPDFVRSGFRHTRSTLQAGFSSDNYHVTEQWGQPVRPYGEWRYPNRPFSVPYGQWGPQLPQVVVGGNQNQWNAFGPTGYPHGAPGNGNGQVGPGMNGPSWIGPNQQGGMPGVGGNPILQSPFLPGGNGNGWGNGPGWGQGGGLGAGGFGVGPGNVLPAGQDEYYPEAPVYHPMSGGGFQSPYRN